MHDPGYGYPLELFNVNDAGQYDIDLNTLLRHTRAGRQPFLLSEDGRVMLRTYSNSGVVHEFTWSENVYSHDFVLAARYSCGRMQLTIRSG